MTNCFQFLQDPSCLYSRALRGFGFLGNAFFVRYLNLKRRWAIDCVLCFIFGFSTGNDRRCRLVLDGLKDVFEVQRVCWVNYFSVLVVVGVVGRHPSDRACLTARCKQLCLVDAQGCVIVGLVLRSLLRLLLLASCRFRVESLLGWRAPLCFKWLIWRRLGTRRDRCMLPGLLLDSFQTYCCGCHRVYRWVLGGALVLSVGLLYFKLSCGWLR